MSEKRREAIELLRRALSLLTEEQKEEDERFAKLMQAIKEADGSDEPEPA